MKRVIVLFAMFMIVSFGIAQVNDVALSDEPNRSTDLKESYDTFNMEFGDQLKSDYNIDFSGLKFGKALKDTELRSGPFSNSDLLNIVVPGGEYLDLYKMLPAENVWIVNYNGSWGFVPILNVMQVKEKKTKADLSLFDVSPKLKSINLVYPEEAENNGIEGKVVMLIHITVDGNVDEAKIVKGVDGLDEAALKAIKSAKFKPAKYEKNKVDVWINYPIDYSLSGK